MLSLRGKGEQDSVCMVQTPGQGKGELQSRGVPIQGWLTLTSAVNELDAEHRFLDPIQRAPGAGEVLGCCLPGLRPHFKPKSKSSSSPCPQARSEGLVQ